MMIFPCSLKQWYDVNLILRLGMWRKGVRQSPTQLRVVREKSAPKEKVWNQSVFIIGIRPCGPPQQVLFWLDGR